MLERWTTQQAWSPVLAAAAKMNVAEYNRDLVHYSFLRHPKAPAPEAIVWPSVVAEELENDGTVFYRVTGMAYR